MNKKTLFSMMLLSSVICVNAVQAEERTGRGLYLGVFGGGAVSDNDSFTQSGIAYKREGDGQAHADYDLYVNTQGKPDSKAAAIGGLHLGYEWSELPIGQSGWGMRPALEVEGYYLGTSQSGNLANPDIEPGIWHGHVEEGHSIAAGAHTFKNSFKMDMGVLLSNVVLTFKTPWLNKIYPYIGAGVGAAITSVSGDSRQVGPLAEPYFNHFNADESASDYALAAQAKAGVRAEITDHLAVFVEYRYLYVDSTSYTFGATVYPGVHSATSAWNANFGEMNFHSGVFGIEYSF